MKINVNQENLKDLAKCGIYRIYRIETGQSYVGSTWKSFKVRWTQHLSKLNTNKHHSKELQNSYNKYGSDAFMCEILEIVEDNSILLEREAFYIEKYDSYHNGYNENPTPSRSPMDNLSSRIKSSETHKTQWKLLEESMTPEEFAKYKEEYAKSRKKEKGCSAWNKGLKLTEEQTKNMRKPKIHGVSKAMKDVHIRNAQLAKDRADYIIVYDLQMNWLNTFWCNSDLVEYSKSEHNTLPLKVRKGLTEDINPFRLDHSIREGKPYKGLYFKRAPKSRKLSYANAVNSWKAESEPIMSQAEDTSPEGAETSGEVQSS